MQDHPQQTLEKILIVEDDPVSLRSLISLFSKDYDITIATNGEDCLSLASTKHGLYLLDLQLPDMHGFDLLKQFHEDERRADIPIIFITANQDIATEETGIRLGAVDFITKPFSPAVLRARVRMHLDLRRKSRELEVLARQDGLTGLANRRQFDEVYCNAWGHAARQKSSMAVIMADIDHFKKVNDSFGHPAGDATLKAVARVMAQEIYRPSDFIARYGGEEFVIILHDTDLNGAVQVAERMRKSVQEAFRAPPEGLPAGVTISLGCASVCPEENGADGEVCCDLDLIQAADDCLVRAKEGGRNRVAY